MFGSAIVWDSFVREPNHFYDRLLPRDFRITKATFETVYNDIGPLVDSALI